MTSEIAFCCCCFPTVGFLIAAAFFGVDLWGAFALLFLDEAAAFFEDLDFATGLEMEAFEVEGAFLIAVDLDFVVLPEKARLPRKTYKFDSIESKKR